MLLQELSKQTNMEKTVFIAPLWVLEKDLGWTCFITVSAFIS